MIPDTLTVEMPFRFSPGFNPEDKAISTVNDTRFPGIGIATG